MAQIHKCGQCSLEFPSEAEYLDHQCGVTGHNPTEYAHAIATNENYGQQAETGLIRGEVRKQLEALGLTPEQAQEASKDVSTVDQAKEVIAKHTPAVPTQ
jgi:hypothetical protein